MATTTNYGWATPDDTDLVKDGAAAIRTLGSSVDTTTKALNPSTTEGDIEYRSSTANTNSRLAIGTAGQVLKVNSGATAPEWGSPSAAITSYALINTGGTSLTGTATTVSGLSGYNKFKIFIVGAGIDSGANYVFCRLNSDTGSNYNTYGGFVYGTAAYSADVANVFNQSANDKIVFGFPSGNNASVTSGLMSIDGGNSSGTKVYDIVSGANTAGGNTQRSIFIGGYYTGSSVISSVTVGASVGNLDAGTVFIYGAN